MISNDQQQNNPWMTGPIVQLPQVQGMGGQNQQQPSIPGRAPMGPLGMLENKVVDVGLMKGLNVAAGDATASGSAAQAAGLAGESGVMAGLATAAPWLAAGYLGGKALRLYNRGTGSVDFGNPADPFGFAKGGFVNPFLQKRQQPLSPNQQPSDFHGGFGGMLTNKHAPLTAKGKGLPDLHARMVRPGGEE